MISIVIPANNEEENIPTLHSRLSEILQNMGEDYEIIIVDDGSEDKTFSVLKEINQKDNKLKAVRLDKRYGQSPALTAGFEHASGEIIIMLDADLQNDPQDLPKVVQEIRNGSDVVCGWRQERKDPLLTKIIPSKIFNAMARFFVEIELHDYGCTLKGFRREALQGIKLYGQTHRLIPALVKLKNPNAKITEIKVTHNPRQHGKARYNIFSGKYNIFFRFQRTSKDISNIIKSRNKSNPLEHFASLYKNAEIYVVADKVGFSAENIQ